jgi:hypothetical protein
MNRITRSMLSGGLVAGLTLLASDASAQARSGAWTRNAPEGEWHMPGRDYSLQRFSPLAQINTTNVANLKAAWTFSTGTLRGHEGNPLVIGNVMYVHTSFPNIVYALTDCVPSVRALHSRCRGIDSDSLARESRSYKPCGGESWSVFELQG